MGSENTQAVETIDTPETTEDMDFDSGFYEESEMEEDTAETPEEDTAPTEETEAPAEAPATEEAPAQTEQVTQTEQNQQPAEAPKQEQFTLKHLGAEKTVSREEMTVLAQKGMDYDRVREKYDEAKPAFEFLSQHSKAAGMSVLDYINHLRTEEKRAAGLTPEQARREVDLENREQAVRAQEEERTRLAQQQAQQTAERSQMQERVSADLARFRSRYPDVKPQDIPQDVWAAVRGGTPLTEAFMEFKLKDAEGRAAAAEQNAKNTGKSTGSMSSAGEQNKGRDPFDEAFGE